MKRLALLVGICVLFAAGGVFAVDRAWDGATNTQWTADNWDSAGFPGSGATPSVIDRATHNANTANDTIVFDSSSGTGNCNCRTIVEFYMDALAANVALTLQVTGDTLNISQFFMVSDDTASQPAKLDFDGGELHIEALDVTGNSTTPAQIDIAADQIVQIGAETRVTSYLDLILGSGAVFDMGRLVINNGRLE